MRILLGTTPQPVTVITSDAIKLCTDLEWCGGFTFEAAAQHSSLAVPMFSKVAAAGIQSASTTWWTYAKVG